MKRTNEQLRDEVNDWVKKQFNFINLDNAESVFNYNDDHIVNHIVNNEILDNYPLHNILYEVRDLYIDNDFNDKVINCGMGIIKNNSHYSTMLFITSGQEDFIYKYWIPLYRTLGLD